MKKLIDLKEAGFNRHRRKGYDAQKQGNIFESGNR